MESREVRLDRHCDLCIVYPREFDQSLDRRELVVGIFPRRGADEAAHRLSAVALRSIGHDAHWVVREGNRPRRHVFRDLADRHDGFGCCSVVH